MAKLKPKTIKPSDLKRVTTYFTDHTEMAA